MQVTKFSTFLTGFIQARAVWLRRPFGILNFVILGQEER